MRVTAFILCVGVSLSISAQAGGSFFPDMKALPSSQRQLEKNASLGNRNASSLSRALGNRSIANGVRHIGHGRAHHIRPEVNLGRMEVLEGILGLLAAAKADKLAKKDDQNADGLNVLPEGSSQTIVREPDVARGPDSGLSDGASREAQLLSAKSVLRDAIKENPELKEALVGMEEDHGITKEKLLDMMLDGKGTREFLAKAPRDPLSEFDAAEAYRKAREAMQSSGASMLADSSAGGGRAPASVDVPKEQENLYQNGKVGQTGLRDALSKSLSKSDYDEDDIELSDDVKAALAAKRAQEQAERARREAKSPSEFDLFEVIHQKYKERENNLRWGEPLRTAER